MTLSTPTRTLTTLAQGLMAASLLACSSAWASDNKIGDRVVNIPAEDEAMASAVAKARATLDQFLELHRHPPPGTSGFRLKVRMTDANGTEYFWFIPFKATGDRFAGVLANKPAIVQSVSQGEVYTFSREQIVDWGYEKDGVQHGSYSVCVLFQRMDPELVNRYKQDHGFVCDD